MSYPVEDTDEMMSDNVTKLADAVVGRRIVSAEQTTVTGTSYGHSYKMGAFVITLNDERPCT